MLLTIELVAARVEALGMARLEGVGGCALIKGLSAGKLDIHPAIVRKGQVH
jgi:hypothetical protein